MITRRDFIVAGISAGGTVLALQFLGEDSSPGQLPAPAVAPEGSTEFAIDAGLGEPMNALLQSMDNTDALGRVWLDSQPARPTLARLGTEITKRIDIRVPDIAQATAKRVQEDFAQNQLCEIEGWRLSLTECQLAGLRVLAIDANPTNATLVEAHRNDVGNSLYAIGEIAPLKNWGPQKTLQGESFNTQPDGHSGLWFQISGAPSRARIMIDGEITKTSIKPEVVTSGLFGKMQERILSTPGEYQIALVDPVKRVKQPLGTLVVEINPSYNTRNHPGAEDGYCPVTKWGPQQTQVGVAQNEQPDGSMGMWVQMECFPKDATLRFGDDPLPLTRRQFGFTTSIPLPLIESPGEKPLVLMSPSAGTEFIIGHIVIE